MRRLLVRESLTIFRVVTVARLPIMSVRGIRPAHSGELKMRRILSTSLIMLAVVIATQFGGSNTAEAAGRGQPTDWNRFNYYPYVYYPHNFQRPQGSNDSLYYRYNQQQRIPVQNKNWYNFYNTDQPYYRGHHFILDVF